MAAAIFSVVFRSTADEAAVGAVVTLLLLLQLAGRDDSSFLRASLQCPPSLSAPNIASALSKTCFNVRSSLFRGAMH